MTTRKCPFSDTALCRHRDGYFPTQGWRFTHLHTPSFGTRSALTRSSMKHGKCPHCGNTNDKFIQDNGEAADAPDLTLLCVARVKPSEWSFDHVAPQLEDFDDAGLVPCGMQWEPNL